MVTSRFVLAPRVRFPLNSKTYTKCAARDTHFSAFILNCNRNWYTYVLGYVPQLKLIKYN